MKRLFLFIGATLLLVCIAAPACEVTGTAFTLSGKPLNDAAVRLVDLDSQRSLYGYSGSNAAFDIDADGSMSQRMRLDVLSPPTQVTGTHIRTRSIIGQSAEFSCGSGQIHQDVHVAVN